MNNRPISEQPEFEDLPFLEDLDPCDGGIHEPSIGPGESVSGLDKWIEENLIWAGDIGDQVVRVDDLREFMKGKVLLSVELAESGMQALRNDAIHHRSKGMHIAAAQCDEDADGIEQALPATQGQANEQ